MAFMNSLLKNEIAKTQLLAKAGRLNVDGLNCRRS